MRASARAAKSKLLWLSATVLLAGGALALSPATAAQADPPLSKPPLIEDPCSSPMSCWGPWTWIWPEAAPDQFPGQDETDPAADEESAS